MVDKHNQARQYELGLEKKWERRNPYFRSSTTLIGINATNAWKLSLHHLLFAKLQKKHNAERSIGIVVFAGILSIILSIILALHFINRYSHQAIAKEG